MVKKLKRKKKQLLPIMWQLQSFNTKECELLLLNKEKRNDVPKRN